MDLKDTFPLAQDPPQGMKRANEGEPNGEAHNLSASTGPAPLTASGSTPVRKGPPPPKKRKASESTGLEGPSGLSSSTGESPPPPRPPVSFKTPPQSPLSTSTQNLANSQNLLNKSSQNLGSSSGSGYGSDAPLTASNELTASGTIYPKERTEVFRIQKSLPLSLFSVPHADHGLVSNEDTGRMLKTNYVAETVILALWQQKSRLDHLFDTQLGHDYYDERDAAYPQAVEKKSSSPLWNKLGDKLLEVHEAVNIMEGISGPSVFVDLNGGPGHFSQLLLNKLPKPVTGYGITPEKRKVKDQPDLWYPSLVSAPNFNRCFGADGRGRLVQLEAVKSLVDLMKSKGHDTAHLVVADGSIEIHKNSQGHHVENLQELFTSRVVLAELLTALKVLSDGGHFVCKLYDTFSHITLSLLYICTQVFKDVLVVKAIRSRIVNSERYLVCKFFKRDDKAEFFVELLEYLLNQSNESHTPLTAVPLDLLLKDKLFLRTTNAMANDIAVKQTKALQLILDAVQRKHDAKEGLLATYAANSAKTPSNSLTPSKPL